MSKELNQIVDVKVLERQKESAEKTSDILCQKVVEAKTAYEMALSDYTAAVEKIVAFETEIKSYDAS
jgi:hypothetical protein